MVIQDVFHDKTRLVGGHSFLHHLFLLVDDFEKLIDSQAVDEPVQAFAVKDVVQAGLLLANLNRLKHGRGADHLDLRDLQHHLAPLDHMQRQLVARHVRPDTLRGV